MCVVAVADHFLSRAGGLKEGELAQSHLLLDTAEDAVGTHSQQLQQVAVLVAELGWCRRV